MIQQLTFTLGGAPFSVSLAYAVAAGYTGRDQQAVHHHIAELAELGVAPPPHIPMLYPLMPTLVTNSEAIAVLGGDTTPEVEVAILDSDGNSYLTVASDHTDRRLEATSVPQAKNACPKILGKELWRIEEVSKQWDELELKSTCEGIVLQEGTLGMLLPYAELMRFFDEHAGRRDNRVLLGGTIATNQVPPKRSGTTIHLSLHDPVLGRTIEHNYTVQVLQEFFSDSSR